MQPSRRPHEVVLGGDAKQQPTVAGSAPEEGTEMRGPRGRSQERKGEPLGHCRKYKGGGTWKLGQDVRTGDALCRAQPGGGGGGKRRRRWSAGDSGVGNGHWGSGPKGLPAEVVTAEVRSPGGRAASPAAKGCGAQGAAGNHNNHSRAAFLSEASRGLRVEEASPRLRSTRREGEALRAGA